MFVFVPDGLEDWTFAADGRMRKRQVSLAPVPIATEYSRNVQSSINEVKITEAERWYGDGWTDEQVDAVVISEKHW